MQTSEEYEELAKYLETILADALKISDTALRSLQAARLIPRMDVVESHREFLIDNLLEIAHLLRTGKEYHLPALVGLSEHVGLGLDGQKSKRRMKQLGRQKGQGAIRQKTDGTRRK